MNHRHWQPNPRSSTAPFSQHIPNANGGSIPGPHLQFIISWLFETTLFTVGLSISTESRCPHSCRVTHDNRQLCIYAYWLNGTITRTRWRSRLTRPRKEQSERASDGGMRPISPAHTCKAPAERWQRAPGQITSDSSFQMPLVKVSIYMSNLRLLAWALVDYSLPSLKSLAHLGRWLLLNWNVPLEYSSPHSKKAALHFDLWYLQGSSMAEAGFCVMYQRLDVYSKRNKFSRSRS